MFLFLKCTSSRMSENKSICATFFRCLSLCLHAFKYIMFSKSKVYAMNVWCNECYVINLGVINVCARVGAVLSSNPSLYPCISPITSHWPLHCGSPNSWPRLLNNKQHRQSSNTYNSGSTCWGKTEWAESVALKIKSFTTIHITEWFHSRITYMSLTINMGIWNLKLYSQVCSVVGRAPLYLMFDWKSPKNCIFVLNMYVLNIH